MRLSGTDARNDEPLPTTEDHNAHVARRRIALMLRANTRDSEQVSCGDEVYFWRDNVGWIGPARVIKVESHGIEVWLNGSVKTASTNRVRRMSNRETDSTSTEPDEIVPQSPCTP